MITIASRGSPLALWQAHYIQSLISPLSSRIKTIVTQGDKGVLGKEAFVKEIQDALIKDTADLAIHSFKDMAYLSPQGLSILAVPKRHDPRDLLIPKNPSLSILSLKKKKNIQFASSSLRRKFLLEREFPGCEVHPLKGNIDTRLKKLSLGEWDGIVLALAGIERLNIYQPHMIPLDPCFFIPAPAQGALAIEGKMHHKFIISLNDLDACFETIIERFIAEKLGGGCLTPLGVHLHDMILFIAYPGKEILKYKVSDSHKKDFSSSFKGKFFFELESLFQTSSLAKELEAFLKEHF